MGSLPRILPITVIDSQTPVPAEAGHHHEQDAGTRGLGQPAPCSLYVQDTAISEADIAREMQYHRAMRPEQSRADAARALVVRELLRLEAERLGLADAPGVGQETSEEARIQQMIEQALVDRVPSEDDCQRYFAQNPEKFRAPDRIRVRHILLAAPADDIAGRLKARTQAEKLIAELLEQPHLFADLAARHSECPSSSVGGDLGWLQRGQTSPEFDRQVFRLREGLAGFPVESRWGYHVVCVDAREEGQPQPFEAVLPQLRDYLELQVRQREVQAYLLQLQERYPVRGLEDIEAQAE